MIFNSLAFVCFFLIVTVFYFILPHKNRWLLLLIASGYFYMAFVPVYILILGFTIVIDYYAGIYIEKFQGRKRKNMLMLSLVANIGVLCIFKYYNFLNEILTELLGGVGKHNTIPYLAIILPIGLSFHTFQALSYTIEVYRGNQKAERHFGIYSLYVMFYPQLVAGPIERPQNMLRQFKEVHTLNYSNVSEGLKRMLWGLVKKIVIADRLSIYVDSIYNNPEVHNGTSILLASIFFAIQIYCDFSGYSDIAIGAARVMGFNLMENFRRPYFSKSISEFWTRWHISLSSWFKDYLYIPLGGNKVSIPRWYFNLFIIFLISGLWHGANWTFIVWGALNGLYLIIHLFIVNLIKFTKINLNSVIPTKIKIVASVIITFLLTTLSWVFFRAESISDALLMLSKMLELSESPYFQTFSDLVLYLIVIALLFIYELPQEYFPNKINFINHENKIIRVFTIASLIIIIPLIGVFDSGQFIYFQF